MPDAPLRVERRQEYAVPQMTFEHRPSRSSIATGVRPNAWAQGIGRISPRTVRVAQLSVVLGIAALMALVYGLHDGFRAELGRALAILAAGDGVAIGDYLLSYGVWAPVASLFLMVLQAVAAPVPAVLVAFANGLTFGVFWGGLLTVAGQTLAATVCFGIARALGRGPVEALSGRLGLETADRWFARWGARGIFVLRLVPGISFDVVSYGAGLTGIGFGSFVAATVIGVTPQAFLYAYLIREAPQTAWVFYAVTWLVVAVIALATFARLRRQSGQPARQRADSVPCSSGPVACRTTLIPSPSPCAQGEGSPSPIAMGEGLG